MNIIGVQSRIRSASVALGLAVLCCAGEASAAQYWLAGIDPVGEALFHRGATLDYMDLFKPDAPWSSVAAKLTAVQISPEIVLRGTDEQLKTILDGLNSRHIALGVTIQLLEFSDGCGKGTEGYGAPRSVEASAKRIKALGGQIDYVNIDEPVTWGHEKQGVNPKGFNFCAANIPDCCDYRGQNLCYSEILPERQIRLNRRYY